MKTILGIIGLLAAFAVGSVNAQDSQGTFVVGTNGTTSATAIVPPAAGLAIVTDLVAVPDAGNTSSTVKIRTGKARKAVTSATTAGTTVWFSNTGTNLTSQGYAIVHETAANTLMLVKVASATATQVQVYETLPNLDTSDYIYPLNVAVPRGALTSWTASGPVNIWLPANLPSALTLDGNTTSCRISVSGYRK